MGDAQPVSPLFSGCCRRCEWLAGTVRAYADLMALRDWEFQVEHGEPRIAGAIAEIEMPTGRKVGRIRVSAALDDLEPDEQRHALAHELVHAHLRDLLETVRSGARQEFGGMTLRLFLDVVELEHERVADGLASAICPVLPLP